MNDAIRILRNLFKLGGCRGNIDLIRLFETTSASFVGAKNTGDIPNCVDSGEIPVSVLPTSSSPASPYFKYRSFTFPKDHPALKHTLTTGGPG